MTDFTLPRSTHRLTLVDSPGCVVIVICVILALFLRYLSSSRQELDTMGNFGQFDIAPPAYGQTVGEEE